VKLNSLTGYKKVFTPSIPNKIPLPQAFNTREESGRIVVSVPKNVCVYKDNGYLTYQLIEYIEKVTLEYNKPITVDFSQVMNITAAASLLMFAVITKCQICIIEPDIINVVLPEDKGMKDLFVNSGLWNGIKPGGISKVRKLIEANNQYLSGSKEIVENVEKIMPSTLINLHNQKVKFTKDRTLIFTKGIGEAILNVGYHAYLGKKIETTLDKFSRLGKERWWQCCWHDQINNRLVFLIYDDGIGIASTLRSKFPEIDEDHKLIKKAMTKGVSRSPKVSRGKGSHDIIQATCIFPNSHVIVMSGNGQYKHDESGVSSKELPFKLKGTLVQWVVDSNDESNHANL